MTRTRILTVCTGNVCRSPFAEFAFQAALDAVAPGGYSVTSAGTQALVGEDMTEQTRHSLHSAGVPLRPFAARRLGLALIDDADIILTATREHRSAVVDLSPAHLRRTFTIREFGRMLESVTMPPQSRANAWNEVLPELIGQRPLFRPDRPEDDDVSDPYRRGHESYARMVSEIMPTTQAIARFAATHSRSA